MSKDNINNYLPSILNPRAVRKDHALSLTQNSIVSRSSLSLRRPNVPVKPIGSIRTAKEISNDQSFKKLPKDVAVKPKVTEDSLLSFSLQDLVKPDNKENSPNIQNISKETPKFPEHFPANSQALADDDSIDFSFLDDLNFLQEKSQNYNKDLTEKQQESDNDDTQSFSLLQGYLTNNQHEVESPAITHNIDCKREVTDVNKLLIDKEVIDLIDSIPLEQIPYSKETSYKAVSSATELESTETRSESTAIYNIHERPTVRVSFGENESQTVDVNTKCGAIKRFSVSHNDNRTDGNSELIENSQLSTDTEVDENMNETFFNSLKRPGVTVSPKVVKKKKLTENDSAENLKVRIINTNANEKLSRLIVPPLNYKPVKRYILHPSKHRNDTFLRNGSNKSAKLTQVTIDRFFRKDTDARKFLLKQLAAFGYDASKEMSKNLGVIDAVKCDRLKSAKPRRELDIPKTPKSESARSPKREIKTATPPPRTRNESLSAHTPRKNVESIHFSLPVKSKSNKTSLSLRNIPHHKIVAGTHFAVDAFSYGEIPNVKHYFLTHFHSDHYSGLKKSFNKLLFCSRITADLCISRLGVNPKNIRVIHIDEVLRIEGVEIVAVDANHCPGALMLVFTLPNGKTMLHTGDFRACPQMESYPVFWNKDIHTVYLDTTYCNPRYDFPTQDQSLEAALNILKQKKMALEKVGKKFSSVLIVCGTYTIGKEKFFMGMSRRVGGHIWACPEKERVLQTVESGCFRSSKPSDAQLHVVPMKDLTHEKLRSYLDSLQGAFSEVVAFKPSGWENGKNSSVEKDLVTIHGIPYSEHSSFSELIRFVKFLKPKQVVPTVDICGGVKSVQKYFPCPLFYKEEFGQTKLLDFLNMHSRQQIPAVN